MYNKYWITLHIGFLIAFISAAPGHDHIRDKRAPENPWPSEWPDPAHQNSGTNDQRLDLQLSSSNTNHRATAPSTEYQTYGDINNYNHDRRFPPLHDDRPPNTSEYIPNFIENNGQLDPSHYDYDRRPEYRKPPPPSNHHPLPSPYYNHERSARHDSEISYDYRQPYYKRTPTEGFDDEPPPPPPGHPPPPPGHPHPPPGHPPPPPGHPHHPPGHPPPPPGHPHPPPGHPPPPPPGHPPPPPGHRLSRGHPPPRPDHSPPPRDHPPPPPDYIPPSPHHSRHHPPHYDDRPTRQSFDYDNHFDREPPGPHRPPSFDDYPSPPRPPPPYRDRPRLPPYDGHPREPFYGDHSPPHSPHHNPKQPPPPPPNIGPPLDDRRRPPPFYDESILSERDFSSRSPYDSKLPQRYQNESSSGPPSPNVPIKEWSNRGSFDAEFIESVETPYEEKNRKSSLKDKPNTQLSNINIDVNDEVDDTQSQIDIRFADDEENISSQTPSLTPNSNRSVSMVKKKTTQSSTTETVSLLYPHYFQAIAVTPES